MISLTQLLNEGQLEKAAEDFLRQTIKGTEWDGKVFIAGGYVRDELMGKDPKDLDIMINTPNGGIEFANWITQKLGVWSEGNPVTFPRFGTAKFNLRGVVHNGIDLSDMDIESVMSREDVKYTPGSRKPEVQFSNLKGDAERRDLTVNAMYKNISTGEYVDPTGQGMEDLKAGIIRTPLDPTKTFTDDPLRMLRVVRFFAKYGWKLAPDLIRALKQNAPQLENISKERVMEELNKMLLTVRPEKAMKLLKITGLMDYIIPEFRDAYEMGQNKYHKDTVWKHTLHVLKNTKPELLNRLMALFHDIGKVATRQVTPKGVQFIGHEKEGAEMALRIMHNLKYPTDISKEVALGVAQHMKLKHGGDEADISDKTLRKFQREVGDKIENILDVIHADNISHADASSMPNQIELVRKKLAQLNATAPEKKGPPINGHDIQKTLGIKPGPIIGKIMGVLVDKMDENPNLSPEEAMNIAKSIVGQQLKETTSKTQKGTPIKRYKNTVGKQVGPQLYVHKRYAARVIPPNILDRGLKVLQRDHPDFKFNTLMLDAESNVIRFDEAPDFDTAREPHVGKVIAVFPDNTTRVGQSNSIWHHKWLWVMDDYDGFDVDESKKWSELWLSKVPEVAKGTDRTWQAQLQQYGLGDQSLTENAEDDAEHEKTREETGYWGDRGAGCLFLSRSTGRLLIQKRGEDVDQPHTWGTWGGAMDKGEDPNDAVQREIAEEAGVTGNYELHPIWTNEKDDFVYYNYLVVVGQEFTPNLHSGRENDDEVESWGWFEYGNWPEPLHFGLKELLDNAGDKIKELVDAIKGQL